MHVALHGAIFFFFFYYHAWIQCSSVFSRLIQRHTLSVTVLHEKSRFSQQKEWWHCLSPWGLNCFTYSFLLLHSRHLDSIGQMILLYLQQGLLTQSSITEDSTYFWFSVYIIQAWYKIECTMKFHLHAKLQPKLPISLCGRTILCCTPLPTEHLICSNDYCLQRLCHLQASSTVHLHALLLLTTSCTRLKRKVKSNVSHSP